MKTFISLSPASFNWFILLSMLLGGCASMPPVYDPIADSDFKGPDLKTVRQEPASWKGTRVRWGGEIVDVENRRQETWIEVVQYPLRSSGRPHRSNTSGGRFIARISGFLDPAIYGEGRQITVIGILEDSIQRTIGDYPYEFPLVTVDTYRLWEKQQDTDIIYYYPDPFWNSRYWYYHTFPWFPYYPYR